MNSAHSASAPTRVALTLVAVCAATACTGDTGEQNDAAGRNDAARNPAENGAVIRDPLPDERRFASLAQLTFEGENAEAYYSSDGQRLIFQRRHEGEYECDQIFTIGVEGGDRQLVSTGLGRTTCAYFFPDDSRIVYSSTHHAAPECPPPPDMRRGYVWALYDFDIYTANPDGSDVQPIFSSPGYDAEATLAPDGSRIVFTSTRDGDLDIYSMNPDGSDVRQLTDEPGYDGGPFFSPDGSKIVYRARYPESEEELADYQALLADGLVRPGVLDIYVMDADGSNRVRLTDNGAANFAPFFHPSGGEGDLRFEPERGRSPQPQFRPLPREFGRHGAGAGDVQRGVRELPHVQPGRPLSRVRIEPARIARGQHEPLHRRVDRRSALGGDTAPVVRDRR